MSSALVLFLILQSVQTNQSVLQKVADSVFRVDCQERVGEEWKDKSHGTAFALGGEGQVITALHAIAACDRVMLHSSTRKGGREARAERILTNRDLAQMRVVQESGVEPWIIRPLSVSTSPLPNSANVFVVGHVLGVPALSSKRLQFNERRPIRDLVPTETLKRIKQAKWLSGELEVLSFSEGHIVPGHSGAPIIDNDGRVVAIAQGGLERGAVESGWGLQVSYVNELPGGETSIPALFKSVDVFFATEQASPAAASSLPSVRCGGVTLTLTRTAALADMRASADDLQGLSLLEKAVSVDGVKWNTGAFVYDIWRDLDSGASIPVPTGSTLKADGPWCKAEHPDLGLVFYTSVERAAGVNEFQTTVASFESRWIRGRKLWNDAAFSYPLPVFRWDGLSFDRDAAFVANLTTQDYAFQSLAVKNAKFVGAVIVRENVSAEPWCAFAWDSSQQCKWLLQRREKFAQFMLGTHLAGWPPG